MFFRAAFILLIFTEYTFANNLSQLVAQHENALLENEWIVQTTPNTDGPWPIVDFIGLIKNANPLQSVAIYYALDRQKDYIPNMLESTPIREVSPTEIHTFYRMKLPWPLGEARYVNGSKLSKSGQEYLVEWYMVQNESAKNVSGWCRFVPHKDGTVIFYHTEILPKSILAGLLKEVIVTDTKKSLIAIKEKIEAVNSKLDTTLPLEEYIEKINNALSGKSVYPMVKKQ